MTACNGLEYPFFLSCFVLFNTQMLILRHVIAGGYAGVGEGILSRSVPSEKLFFHLLSAVLALCCLLSSAPSKHKPLIFCDIKGTSATLLYCSWLEPRTNFSIGSEAIVPSLVRPPRVRQYQSVTQAAREVCASRIYGGIEAPNDALTGREYGLQVGQSC